MSVCMSAIYFYINEIENIFTAKSRGVVGDQGFITSFRSILIIIIAVKYSEKI